ncbi:adenylyltransferase/cytidyltransferase family protein [Pseudonocardia sp.]|uniref:adenylyltransferase/cytidyltransferase family protein n=1 Tax=Pseudonocardia sp. TaxID=60912 RepID=UPI003D147044
MSLLRPLARTDGWSKSAGAISAGDLSRPTGARLHSGVDELPPALRGGIVAIGQFDGVHRGHRELVSRARRRADELSVAAGVVTFSRHPASLLRPLEEPPSLCTLQDKVEMLVDCGADFVIALPVSAQLLQTPPADFVTTTLLRDLQARSIVVGANFRFGHKAAGDAGLLREIGRAHGTDVVIVDLLDVDEGPVSSTRIRGLIAAGHVHAAARLLGREHCLDSVVTAHRQGVITACFHAGVMSPAPGVYEVAVEDLTSLNRTRRATTATIGPARAARILASPSFARPPVDGQMRLSFLGRVPAGA